MIAFFATALALSAADTSGPLLTAVQARALGREANLGFQSGRLQEDIAASQERASLGSLLPTVSFGSTLSRVGPNFAGDVHTGNLATSSYGVDDQWSAQLTAQWMLLNPAAWFQWRSNEALHRSSQARVQGLQGQLDLALDLAYHDVVRQQALLSSQLDALVVSLKRRDIARVHHQVGTGSLLELRQAQLTANADSSALLSQESALSLARRQLNVLLARPADEPFRVLDTIPVSDPGDSASLLADALRTSTALSDLDARIESQRSLVRSSASAAYLPTLSAFSTYGVVNRWNDPSTAEAHWQGFVVGLQLSVPVFSGGSQDAQLGAARSTLHQTELARQDTLQQLRKSFAQAWTVWKQAKSAMDLEETNLDLADSTLATSLGQYSTGTIAGIDLRTTQELTLQARSRRVTARYAARAASQQLLYLASRPLAP